MTHLKTAVVDLVPVLPGGQNGGAKVLALSLVQHLALAAPETRFVLLTSSRSDRELSLLDAPNVERFRVDAPATNRPAAENAALRSAGLLRNVLPDAFMDRMAAVYHRVNRLQGGPSLLQRLGADLLFCPFTAPNFDDGITPFVSLVVDLQHRYLPKNFEERLRLQLERRLQAVLAGAARIVCLSDYVRETLLEAGACPDILDTIYSSVHTRLRTVPTSHTSSYLAKWDLVPCRYLLYPANFWPHKNHTGLVRAFEMASRRNPASDLKLVLTGSPGAARERVIGLAQTSGLADRIVFPGYVPEEELAALYHGCLAVIFPSLYEGFGMPVVEAMAAGKPVLCSNAASLPEVSSGAALLFDAYDVAAMAHAIGRIEGDANLRSALVQHGRDRSASFGDAAVMAGRYLQSFHSALEVRRPRH